MYKTHTCGELRRTHVGERVTLAGWVHRRRDHGGVVFMDLRDRFGFIQVVVDPDTPADATETIQPVRLEWVIQVEGIVRDRLPGAENPNLPTGEIEVLVQSAKVLNPSKALPFVVNKNDPVDEHIRLRYRYLDLRRERMSRNLVLRHRTVQYIRDYLNAHDVRRRHPGQGRTPVTGFKVELQGLAGRHAERGQVQRLREVNVTRRGGKRHRLHAVAVAGGGPHQFNARQAEVVGCRARQLQRH